MLEGFSEQIWHEQVLYGRGNVKECQGMSRKLAMVMGEMHFRSVGQRENVIIDPHCSV